MKPIIIIEHLEPKLWPWCKIEYESISKIIPKSNLLFTNIKSNYKFIKRLGKISKKSIKNIKLKNACILDPNAKKTLTPEDTKKFKYFIIGGILGDYPPKKRTEIELSPKLLPNAERRNLGKEQMSTDNAIYVTKKIVEGIARIKAKLQDKLYLGNLDAKRDWGYAPEYVEAMWLMLQQDKPDDFVIATGETHTIKEFVEAAFERAKIKNWRKYIDIDERYYRPNEVNLLQGDASKAKKILKWKPKTKFTELVNVLVDFELKNSGVKK